MKKLGIGAIIIVGLIVGGGVAFSVWANSEYTACYGIFATRGAAESAAKAAREAGLDAAGLRPTLASGCPSSSNCLSYVKQGIDAGAAVTGRRSGRAGAGGMVSRW